MRSAFLRRIQILRDFKPIFDLDLHGENISEERITGSKIDLSIYSKYICKTYHHYFIITVF